MSVIPVTQHSAPIPRYFYVTMEGKKLFIVAAKRSKMLRFYEITTDDGQELIISGQYIQREEQGKDV